MKKSTPRDPEKTQAVKWVAAKYQTTPQYVYGILNGTFVGGQAEEITKSYNDKYNQLKAVLS